MTKRFRAGKVYKFKSVRKMKSPAEKAGGLDSIRFRYLRTIQGNGVVMHQFLSETGRYLEDFTESQLDDFDVREAA